MTLGQAQARLDELLSQKREFDKEVRRLIESPLVMSRMEEKQKQYTALEKRLQVAKRIVEELKKQSE